MNRPKILIVEDELIIAKAMGAILNDFGYFITDIIASGEDAIESYRKNIPDIVLMDIKLRGQLDGIETAKKMKQFLNKPVIFLTDHTDSQTIDKAIQSNPTAYLVKPFNERELKANIDISLHNARTGYLTSNHVDGNSLLIDDAIFIRDGNVHKKVLFSAITYIEADRAYCKIFTQKGHQLLTISMNKLRLEEIDKRFVRVHRSYIVNVEHIDTIMERNNLTIGDKIIPIGKTYRDEFMCRFNIM